MTRIASFPWAPTNFPPGRMWDWPVFVCLVDDLVAV